MGRNFDRFVNTCKSKFQLECSQVHNLKRCCIGYKKSKKDCENIYDRVLSIDSSCSKNICIKTADCKILERGLFSSTDENLEPMKGLKKDFTTVCSW